eukprot:jgi/Mesvir1/24840/Mv22078-RA.2
MRSRERGQTSAALPRTHEYMASAMPGCVRATTRPGCPPFLGAPPPSPCLSPWPRHAQHLKPPNSFSAAKGTCTLPTSARLRDRSGKDASKPGNKSSSAHGPKQPDSSTQGGEGTKAQESGQHAQRLPRLDDGKQPPSPAAGSSPMPGRAKPPRPAFKTVRAPMLKGMEPEGILRWLEDARRGNDVVRTTGMLAALNELMRIKLQSKKDARDANPAKNSDIARDPRFSQLLEQVWARWEDDPGSFTNRDLESLARNLAKLGGDASKGLDRMEGEAMKRLSSMDSRQIAGIVWAFAKAGRGDTIFDAMGVQLLPRGFGSFNAQDISNTVWAFATAGKEASQLFAAVEKEVLARGFQGFKPQNIANLVWAFATAGKEASQLFAAVEKEVLARGLQEFNPQNIANLVWAFATAGKEASQLFAAVEKEVLARGLQGFNPQGITNLVWAFATAGKEASQLFAAVEKEVLARGLQGFNPQDFANLVWAFATAGKEASQLFAAVEKEVLASGLQGFNPQNIANLVWAFATASVGAPGLFAAVEVEAGTRGLREFTAQGISNMAWAFAKAGREASGLLGAVQDEALGRGLDSFNPQNVSNLAHAFATAGKGTPALYAAVEAWVEVRALQRSALANAGAVEQGQVLFECVYVAAEAGMAEWVAEGLRKQNAANTLWALAVAGRPDSDAARALMVAWTKLAQPTDKDFGLQLNQVCQYILACVDASDHARDRYCSALLERWRDTAMSGKQQPGPSSSDLHLEVSKVLRGMGIAHKNEVPFFHGLSYVDILVDGQVAVEVDGPSHFYQDSGAITAVTLFKRRLLEKGGFTVVAIPYMDWDRLKGRLEQENYLRHKLQGVSQ